MKRTSAGLLMFRRRSSGVEFFLVHPGGPFFKNKDFGAWSIPNGEYEKDEDALAAAKREFEEETGIAPRGDFLPIGDVTQSSGKIVTAWAFEGDCDADDIRSNTFSIEWPPKSGKQQEFPEVDRAGWFSPELARTKILKAQAAFLDRVMKIV
jgi:predicted NUDIX family NTP pyrophosphohydrolase